MDTGSVKPRQSDADPAPNSVENALTRCLSLDLEVGRADNRIHALAGVRPDMGQKVAIPRVGRNLPRALARLDELAHGADFVLGHNLIDGVVQDLLRGTGAQGRQGGLHPVPRQRLRVPGRRAAPVPERQCQGDHPGQGRGEAADLEPADAGLCPASGLRGPAVSGIPSADQGQGGKRREVRQAQHVAQHPLHRRRGPERPGAGVVRRGGQRPGPRDDQPGAVGGADRGATTLGQGAGSGHAGPVRQDGPEGVQRRLCKLGRLPLRRPLEVGGRHGAGGRAPGDGGSLGR